MDRIKAIKILAIGVMAGGLIEIIGWLAGVQALKSVRPSMVTMKFSTAVSFLMSGITLYFMAESRRGRATLAQVVLPATALVIMLIMATLFASTVFGLKSGVEDMFIREGAVAVKTTVPGRPSIVTMMDFILISIAAISVLFRSGRERKILFAAGAFLMATGVIALCGYALGVEYLYYSWPGLSTGMALVTALLFVLMGYGILMLSGEES